MQRSKILLEIATPVCGPVRNYHVLTHHDKRKKQL